MFFFVWLNQREYSQNFSTLKTFEKFQDYFLEISFVKTLKSLFLTLNPKISVQSAPIRPFISWFCSQNLFRTSHRSEFNLRLGYYQNEWSSNTIIIQSDCQCDGGLAVAKLSANCYLNCLFVLVLRVGASSGTPGQCLMATVYRSYCVWSQTQFHAFPVFPVEHTQLRNFPRIFSQFPWGFNGFEHTENILQKVLCGKCVNNTRIMAAFDYFSPSPHLLGPKTVSSANNGTNQPSNKRKRKIHEIIERET